jgi:glutathione S-transferase
MPKPDQLALTGGYRRAPVLQIGADVYCDSALIARVLERLQPTPSLFPAGAPLAPLLAQWADSTLFWTAIPYTLQPAGLAVVFAGLPPEAVQAFAADRKPFSAGVKRPTLADATLQLQATLATLDAQLADGRPWLFGADASIADFSVGHCLWFVHRVPPVAGVLDAAPHVRRWLSALLAIGHGRSQRLDSAAALAVAAASTPAPQQVMAAQGLEAGQPVTVSAVDYGTEPSAGTLVGLAADEVVIQRSDPRAGTVHVHFPRSGYQIKPDLQETR